MEQNTCWEKYSSNQLKEVDEFGLDYIDILK